MTAKVSMSHLGEVPARAEGAALPPFLLRITYNIPNLAARIMPKAYTKYKPIKILGMMASKSEKLDFGFFENESHSFV